MTKIKNMDLLDLKEFIVCGDCGLVWHLPTMKIEQCDWNKLFQEVKCLECGNIVYDERREE